MRALHFISLYSNLKSLPPRIWLMALMFPAMIVLGVMLAVYADSPYLIIPFLSAMVLVSFAVLEYALYSLVAFLPFSFRFIFTRGTEMQVPTEPLLAIMSVAIVLRWIIMARRKKAIIKFPFRLPMVMYGFSMFLSLMNSNRLYSSAKGSIRAIAYMMLAVLVFSLITDKKRLKRFFIISIIPATIAVGWTVIFLIDRLDMWQWTSAYEGLLFTSYSHYGAFVAVILLILFARAMYDKGIYDRVAWYFLLGFFFIAMCLSFSRGAWISLMCAIGFLLFQKSSGVKYKKILIVISAVALLGFLLIVPYASKIIISRAQTMTNLGYAANRERILRWGTAIMMFQRHPVIGCGYGTFAFTYVNDPAIVGVHLSQYKMGAHNEYLQALAELGLIGFLALMWIVISFFLYGFRLLKRLKNDNSFYRSIIIGVMSAELSLLLHFMVNNMIQADIVGVPFWILIGALPAIGNIMEKEGSNSS